MGQTRAPLSENAFKNAFCNRYNALLYLYVYRVIIRSLQKGGIPVLKIENLHVNVDGKEILKGINLEVGDRTTCVLFGPNGSGKSTLLATIMGFRYCEVTKGKIIFNGTDVTNMSVDERAKMGMGMMMQRPPNVVGVKLRDILKATAKGNEEMIDRANEFKMSEFLDRDINVGFSGGEIKRSELLQLTAQNPSLLLLDEPESGVDLESIDMIGKKIKNILTSDSRCHGNRASALVITHTGQILDYVGADCAYVMRKGTIGCSGRPSDILAMIKEKGYEECVGCIIEIK